MSEIPIKRVCCTCLSTDRKLYQLCRIFDGINLLYMVLSHDPEAYKEGFYKDTASLHVCWECGATVNRIKRFQIQACAAQKQLSSIVDGRNHVKLQIQSRLTTTHNTAPNYEFQSSDMITENFIDCGPVKEFKIESDTDDIPLSVFYYENDGDNCDEPGNSNFETGNSNFETGNSNFEPASKNFEPGNSNFDPGSDNTEPCKLSSKSKNESPNPGNTVPKLKSSEPGNLNNNPSEHGINTAEQVIAKKKTKMKYSKYFSIVTMNEEEMLKSMEKKTNINKESVFKCDNCILEFKAENELTYHKLNVHLKKDNLSKCDIKDSTEGLDTHKQHYQWYNCMLCTHTAHTHIDIVGHLKRNHKEICGKKRGSKRERNGLLLEKLHKYPCPECESCFQNKDLRWKHVQKAHKEGYKCGSCDKKFAFKNNLERHERIHQGPLPREECPTCHKMIRIDLLKVHSRIHTDRQKYTCVECDKSFVSRETYESHLKYTRAHATVEVCRHKCPSCHKRYRSRGELRDHVNYQHKGQAEHKCPICGKGLATKRCIRRHVRRAHEGIKESAKDKICQQCGKAFRDKKGLIEHERVHSGARPLSCAACGRAFRQRAALYAHTRRLHPPLPDTS